MYVWILSFLKIFNIAMLNLMENHYSHTHTETQLWLMSLMEELQAEGNFC